MDISYLFLRRVSDPNVRELFKGSKLLFRICYPILDSECTRCETRDVLDPEV
jgi:hypothetical protein